MLDGRWRGRDRLVGGLYGVGFDRVFCGESMFSRAARPARWRWPGWWRCAWGVELLDCQFITPHLASMGAVEISQKRYLSLLREAQRSASGGGGASPPSASLPNGNTGGVGTGAVAAARGFRRLGGGLEVVGISSSPGNFIAQSLTHVIDRVLDHVERRAVLEQPAREDLVPDQRVRTLARSCTKTCTKAPTSCGRSHGAVFRKRPA
jgi:hypothetical protein